MARRLGRAREIELRDPLLPAGELSNLKVFEHGNERNATEICLYSSPREYLNMVSFVYPRVRYEGKGYRRAIGVE